MTSYTGQAYFLLKYVYATVPATVRVAPKPKTPRKERALRSGSQTVGIMQAAAIRIYMSAEGANFVPKSLNMFSPCTLHIGSP